MNIVEDIKSMGTGETGAKNGRTRSSHKIFERIAWKLD
jgi:hypothetical protein